MCFRLVMIACGLAFVGGRALAQQEFESDYEDDGLDSTDETIETIELTVRSTLDELGLARDELASDSVGDVMRNDAVLELVRAEFSDTTIKAVIAANDTAFDVTPKALVALKSAGVSEAIIETMVAIESDRRTSIAAEPDTQPAPLTDAVEPPSADSIAMLSQAIERLAATPPPVAPAQPPTAPEPPDTGAGPGPHAWVLAADGKTRLAASHAQVAFTETKGTGATALRTLEGLSSRKALVFASPALAIANEIGGLFRSDDPTTTAVWALPNAKAAHRLPAAAVLEVDFAGIPGVNPDDYKPAVIQLVPTIDNFRLVGAARTKVSDLESGTPTEPIVEEPVAARIDRLARGTYRIALYDNLPSGEYALVLRPIERKQKRRGGPASLGELLGTGAGSLLYATWDFALAADAAN